MIFIRILIWMAVWNMGELIVNKFVDDKIIAMAVFGVWAVAIGNIDDRVF